MERQTQLNIRVSLEEKAQILKAAKASGMGLSEYVRSQALLKPGSLSNPSQKASTFPAPPKPPEYEVDLGAPQKEALDTERLSRLVTQLKAQGMTTPAATREAKKRLGL